MSERWFWRVDGTVFGPVHTEHIVRQIEAGQIGPKDDVRVGEDGPWIPSLDVLNALNGHQSNTATSAAEALEKAKRTGVRISSAPARNALGQWILARFSSIIRPIVYMVAAPFRLVPESLHTKTGKLLVVGMLVSLFAMLMQPMTPWGDPSIDNIAGEINLAHLLINDLRDRNASDEEWDRTQVAVLTSLKPLVKQMEDLHQHKPANVDYMFAGSQASSVIRRNIISAGKYGIPMVLLDVRNDDDPVVDQLNHDVAAILKHVTGEEPYPLTVAEARRRKKQTLRSERQWKVRRDYIKSIDPTTAAIACVDGILLIGGAVFFYRRRKKR